MLSFLVWLHHFFTMEPAPTSTPFWHHDHADLSALRVLKIFNWIFTFYGGRIRFTTPIYWTIGFIVTFVIGGIREFSWQSRRRNFVLHNSLFLIAHFHNVIIGALSSALWRELPIGSQRPSLHFE